MGKGPLANLDSVETVTGVDGEKRSSIYVKNQSRVVSAERHRTADVTLTQTIYFETSNV